MRKVRRGTDGRLWRRVKWAVSYGAEVTIYPYANYVPVDELAADFLEKEYGPFKGGKIVLDTRDRLR